MQKGGIFKLMICILTESELARSHGTGAQILQMFQGAQFHHFYWKIGHGQRSEVPQSTLLADWIPNVPKIGGVVRRLRRLSGMTWWHGNQINAPWLRHLLRSQGLTFDVVYVVIARESDAQRALSIVRQIGAPYVLHMMDILETDGLKPERMPAIGELLKGASQLISLLPSITREMRQFVRTPVREISIGQKITAWTAREFEDDRAVRLVMVGRPYRGGCELLANAWEAAKLSERKMELVYYGTQHNDMPAKLRNICRDGGYISNGEAYRKILAEAHLAFLSGPNANDMHGKWSFPSRTVDYLMAGLPVLACVSAGSATEDVLKPISPQAVAFTRSESDIIEAINRFTADQEAWVTASRAARSFAEKTMSLEVVRERVLAALETAKVKGDEPLKSRRNADASVAV